MNNFIDLSAIADNQRKNVGGKAFNLHLLMKEGFRVPGGFVISDGIFRNFVEENSLNEKIYLMLNREDLDSMRWEQIWDLSLSIRNLFQKADFNAKIRTAIESHLIRCFEGRKVVIRSSSLNEDSAETSFAGIHESFVGVSDISEIIEHIKLVYASLYSDRAILYRKELGLDFFSDTMPVIIQELVEGEFSGLLFTKNPEQPENMAIETVFGLNEDLVDGKKDPERWIVDRKTGKSNLITGSKRILSAPIIDLLAGTGLKIERIFDSPQDIEWTMRDGELFLLQARPISTLGRKKEKEEKLWEKSDKREWYLSLQLNFGELEKLHALIVEKCLPEMEKEAMELSEKDLSSLSRDELGEEIVRREKIFKYWKDVYWEYFIPFAHGMRLFGQIYNEKLNPNDPHKFLELLHSKEMLSVRRNSEMWALAGKLKLEKSSEIPFELKKEIETFAEKYNIANSENLIDLLLEMEETKADGHEENSDLIEEYFGAFSENEKDFARKLLRIGKASYRLRDDDNLYLGKIEFQLERALKHAGNFIKTAVDPIYRFEAADVAKALEDEKFTLSEEGRNDFSDHPVTIRERQLIGMPAVKGFTEGIARTIRSRDDIFKFKKGEILVCDSIDPNMTFVVPLAKGIVERRGGMLIHGAIIAREYGIPCITGIKNATESISTGDRLQIDAYLGIVTIESA